MMEKLRSALGRFTSGLCNVDELRSVFRDYLRDHPEKREAVARWLADSIRIGRVSPALMLTIGDLLAPPKATSAKVSAKSSVSKAATEPPRAVESPASAGASALDATARRVARPVAPSPPPVSSPGPASDFDRTIYPQPIARSPIPSAPQKSPERPVERDSTEELLSEEEHSQEEHSEEERSEEESSEDTSFDPILSLPPSSFGGTMFPDLPPDFPDGTRGRSARPPTRRELPVSRLRSIDQAVSTEMSVIELTNIEPTSEAMAADAEAAKVGDVLDNRYKLVMELGRGGMGSVYKALDRNREDFHARNPYIALKLLSEEFRRHPDAVMALQRETERAQSLAHENIVKVFDFDYDGPHAYMTMELLEGESLEGWLNGPDFERATHERKWRMVEQIGAALSCAHKNGVVHSDLKPGNIFVCSSGTVKVMDFGIARPLREVGAEKDTTLFDPGKRLGGLTPAYASLEQWNQERPDTRDDVYSFACVVYYIYAGKHPRGSITSKEELENSPSPRRIRSLTLTQWETLRRGLALRRKDRVASVHEFLLEFAPRSWLRRYRTAIAATGAAAILTLSYFGVLYYEDFAADQALNSQLWPSTDAPTKPLTAEQRRDIEDYLYLGKAALQQAGNTQSAEELSALLSKGDNNLLELLKRVREIDPANAQALQLTRDAANLFESRAEALLSANRPADSLRLVVEGQNFAHTYDLFRLKRTICRSRAELCRGAAYN